MKGYRISVIRHGRTAANDKGIYIGRTDFPTGSMSAIVRSIKGKILVLPDDTKVFPGHGESTSVAYEKKYNPFLQ